MLVSQRIATRERRASHWRTSSPWTTCVKVACCSRLRFMWFALMVLTVLCVALQMMGVVRQARSSKVLKLASEQLVQVPPEIHRPMKHNDWENFWPVSVVLLEEPAEQKHQKFLLHRENTKEESVEKNNSQVLTIVAKEKHDSPSSRRIIITKSYPSKKLVNKFHRRAQNFPNQPPQERSNHKVVLEKSGQAEKLKPTRSKAVSENIDAHVVKSQADNSVTCQPKNHIVFLKTHKTASSTILNILYRYGDSHNLTFALPLNMHSQLFYPAFFAAHFVEGVRTHSVKEFHILCNHMRFNSQEVRKLMPKDTFYFSILRHPVAMMESLFVYYKAIPAFRGVKSLEDFLIQSEQAYNISLPNNHYARNILTFDFGLNNTAPANSSELEWRSAEVISAIERDFPMVLISEYFDESLVLLKHALCWSLDDVSSFRLNSRSKRRPLSPDTAEQIKEWNSLDWRVYRHFNATFWRRIDSTLGRTKLQQEVELLRARRRKLEDTCLLGGGAVDPGQVRDSSLRPFQSGTAVIQGYNLRPGLSNHTGQLCQRLVTPELQYTSALYVKQFPLLAAARTAALQKMAAQRVMK